MNDGHFWVSYYDKYATQHDQMGAVSYRGAELSEYTNTYFHDYHGWRETLETADSAFNAFTAESDDPLSAVSFYTSEDDVAYTVTIYGRFENGELLDPLATASDTIERTGYHTVDLAQQVAMQAGDDFYVQVSLSSGGQAIDWTSDVPVLLGAPAVTDGTIVSDASAGESYYLDGAIWKDLYDLPLNNSEIGRDVTGSANFCIRAMSEVAVPEPSAVVLLLLGAFGLLAIKRREN